MKLILMGGFIISVLAKFFHEEAFVMTVCEDDICVEKYVVREEDKYGNWLHNTGFVMQQ